MDRLALRLINSPYEIADVEAFAAHWAISPVMAGVELMKWCDSGVAPSVEGLTGPDLGHLAYPPTPPTWLTRARLRDELDGQGEYTEEQLALALVKWGSVGRAAERLARWQPSGRDCGGIRWTSDTSSCNRSVVLSIAFFGL